MENPINEFADKLHNDLLYAAPEIWPEHIKRRMNQLANALKEDDDETQRTQA